MKPTFDHDRPLSWSAISSFEYDKEQWYRKYVLKMKERPNAEMLFGKKVGERLAKEPDFLPCVPRLPVFEHKFETFLDDIPLIGYADSFDALSGTRLKEYKTGVKAWDQKRADAHGQVDMYLLMHLILEKIRPEDVETDVIWLPTQKKECENGDFSKFDYGIEFVPDIESRIMIFRTKRTMVDILKFGERIRKTHVAMEKYCEDHE